MKRKQKPYKPKYIKFKRSKLNTFGDNNSSSDESIYN